MQIRNRCIPILQYYSLMYDLRLKSTEFVIIYQMRTLNKYLCLCVFCCRHEGARHSTNNYLRCKSSELLHEADSFVYLLSITILFLVNEFIALILNTILTSISNSCGTDTDHIVLPFYSIPLFIFIGHTVGEPTCFFLSS